MLPPIANLPKSLIICGNECEINTDYRVVLWIFRAFSDPELSQKEKIIVMLDNLYKDDIYRFNTDELKEACEKAQWYLDGGGIIDEQKSNSKPIIDWEQDEKMIFSAVNKVAQCEVRSIEYMHWWTFLGYFGEIGECLLTTVINIRQKMSQHKPIEKWEKEFVRDHKNLITIKTKLTDKEQSEVDKLKEIMKRKSPVI